MKTPSLKRTVARKAAKTTVRHTVRGTGSKLRRDPLRAMTLLSIGMLAGLLAGWLLSRNGSDRPQ